MPTGRPSRRTRLPKHPEKAIVVRRIAADLAARLDVLLDLGLGYLTLERTTPTLSPGELQRLRLATQVRSNLFGVVYVLDEPSAGLHPADTEALLRALDRLLASGNSLFVVEHDLDVIRQADWIVDVGPGAGEQGGQDPLQRPARGLEGCRGVEQTRRHLFGRRCRPGATPREPRGWLEAGRGDAEQPGGRGRAAFPLGAFTSVTGVSGSGKSSLVSQALVELVAKELGAPNSRRRGGSRRSRAARRRRRCPRSAGGSRAAWRGSTAAGPGRPEADRPDPRSNLATYTGLFDHVRKSFAATPAAKARKFDAGRFSFNVAKGRCAKCEGEGSVMVELLFLPSVYAPCPVCQGSRYNAETLAIRYRNKNIADVLALTIDAAWEFFADEPAVLRPLTVLREVGLGYLRLGQPATELSGGEAQRIKLATELQRAQRGDTLYVLDEPTTGLHPADVDRLLAQLMTLVDAGNTVVVVVEHEMRVAAAGDWVIDIGPGAGEDGGHVVAAGPPIEVAKVKHSLTAPYLARALAGRSLNRPAEPVHDAFQLR